MRVLYLTHIDFLNLNNSGVSKKILSQCKAFESQNCSVDLICVESDCIAVKSKMNSLKKQACKNPIIEHLELAAFICKWVKKSSRYDLVYIRQFPTLPPFMSILSFIRRYCPKIVMEVPTYPYDQELKDKANRFFKERKYFFSWVTRGRLAVDRILRHRLIKYIDRIVIFDKYEFIWKIPTIQTINGVDVEDVTPVSNTTVSEQINIIAVAALADWHGYDRFISGMGKYYKNGGMRNIHFHVVGEGNVLPLYKDISQKFGIQKHITFYGIKTGKELDNIYDKCEIGISSLGLHRIGLSMGSFLKTREYLAKGLPMITACDIDILDSGYPYFHQFSPDDSPIDMDSVIEFYDNIYKKSGKIKQEIIDEIRGFAYRTCDMNVTMKPVLDYLLSAC